jgi:hypothetical protein
MIILFDHQCIANDIILFMLMFIDWAIVHDQPIEDKERPRSIEEITLNYWTTSLIVMRNERNLFNFNSIDLDLKTFPWTWRHFSLLYWIKIFFTVEHWRIFYTRSQMNCPFIQSMKKMKIRFWSSSQFNFIEHYSNRVQWKNERKALQWSETSSQIMNKLEKIHFNTSIERIFPDPITILSRFSFDMNLGIYDI